MTSVFRLRIDDSCGRTKTRQVDNYESLTFRLVRCQSDKKLHQATNYPHLGPKLKMQPDIQVLHNRK